MFKNLLKINIINKKYKTVALYKIISQTALKTLTFCQNCQLLVIIKNNFIEFKTFAVC